MNIRSIRVLVLVTAGLWGLPARALAEPLLVVTICSKETPAERLKVLQQALVGAVEATGAEVVGPDEVHARLLRDDSLGQSRQRARELLARATDLVHSMFYEKATEMLAAAEKAALDGLARVADPRILSEIRFQKGIALLPTDPETSHRSLVESYRDWPARSIPSLGFPPKILAALGRAARQARELGVPVVTMGEASVMARALKARRLVLALMQKHLDHEQVDLQLYSAAEHRWLWSTTASWPARAPGADVRSAIAARLRVYMPAAARSKTPTPRSPRSTLAAVALGVGAAGAVAGVVLSLVAHSKEQEVEDLAQKTPLVEYAPRVLELEQAGRSTRDGAVACFVVAGVAAVVAVALWLWPNGKKRSLPSVAIHLGAGRQFLSLTLP